MTSINKEKCIGCGLCAQICSEGFEMNETEMKAKVKDSKAPCMSEAIKQCPVDAIGN